MESRTLVVYHLRPGGRQAIDLPPLEKEQIMAYHTVEEYDRYKVDWQADDFYKYNPINDETKHMNYVNYIEGREAGTIPAPDSKEVLNDLYNPIHVEHDGA